MPISEDSDAIERITHWVKPALPKLSGDLEYIPLPNTDAIFILGVDFVWILPGPLQADRFKQALSLTLRDFPHCAGRLSHDTDTRLWRVRLTDEPVSFTVGKNTEVKLTEDILNNHHPDVADTLALNFETPKDAEHETLLRFKVTEWTLTGETTITMSISHALNDGPGAVHLMQTLSAYYTHSEPPPAPTLEKFFQIAPPVSQAQFRSTLPLVSMLALDYRADELWKAYITHLTSTERVDLTFTRPQLDKLKQKANTLADGVTFSAMDSLAGYLATLLNRIDGVPVEDISHIIGYRGASIAPERAFIPPPLTSQGNVTVAVQTEVANTTCDTPLEVYARALNSSKREALSPNILPNIIGLCDKFLTRAIETKRYFNFAQEPGNMGINSLYRTPYLDVHFGYKGQVRFFFDRTMERYMHIHPANPIKHKGEGGRIRWESLDGGADVHFRVKIGLRDKVLAIVKKDMSAM